MDKMTLPAEQDSDETLIAQIAQELTDLRFEHERRIGRILAQLNFRARQRELQLPALGAQCVIHVLRSDHARTYRGVAARV